MGNKELAQKKEEEKRPARREKLLVDVPSWGFIVYIDPKSGKKRPYINHAGMLAKLDVTYGAGNYQITSRPIVLYAPPETSMHEIEHPVYGKIPVANFAYHYCEIKVKAPGLPDSIAVFNGEFISHKGNTNIYFLNNINGLNETRAINRAIRKATACGFVSVEELKEVTVEGMAVEAVSEAPTEAVVAEGPKAVEAPVTDAFMEAVHKVLKLEEALDESVKLYACKKAGIPVEKYTTLTRDQLKVAYKDLESWAKKDRDALIDYLSHLPELPTSPELPF